MRRAVQVSLTEYFQHRSVEKLYLNKRKSWVHMSNQLLNLVGLLAEWYTSQNSDRFLVHVDEQVTSIDPDAHVVLTSKNRSIPYDLLTLATGSDATLPPCITKEQTRVIKGVFVYRNISDLDKLMAYTEREEVKGGRAIVVGGGLLGLEAANAIHDLCV